MKISSRSRRSENRLRDSEYVIAKLAPALVTGRNGIRIYFSVNGDCRPSEASHLPAFLEGLKGKGAQYERSPTDLGTIYLLFPITEEKVPTGFGTSDLD